MKKGRTRRVVGVLVAAMFVAACMSPPLRAFENLPDAVNLKSGSAAELHFTLPGTAELVSESETVISSFDQSLDSLGSTVTLKAGDTPGTAKVTYRFLGLIPVKTVAVTVEAEKTLIPGGQSVGVAMLTEGVVVVGSSDIGNTPSPARIAGIKAGDRIVRVNDTDVTSAAQLQSLIGEGGEALIEVVRGEEVLVFDVEPVRDSRDGAYRLGAWVRDSTAGIGTLTFFDPVTEKFGALGHAITDVDTGIVLPVGYGGIYESSVVDVNKGKSGQPGELLGQFFDVETQLGEVKKNTDFGIFGTINDPLVNPLYPNGLLVGTRADVHVGAAQLLTTLVDGKIRAYDCEIVKLTEQSVPTTRSMVVKITDDGLLDATGGIVQGMSGSPIVQDGRLVGAVTHVFINDPAQGYGIYIEWMLDAAREGSE
ncbi:MAG: SpoIVB peptidase [Clostridiales bacterium]|nr:SpoIVB peptidase [Clostridiales bacterium]